MHQVQINDIEVLEPFFADTSFPQNISGEEFDELAQALFSQPEAWLRLVREAVCAQGGPLAPDASCTSGQLLEDLAESLDNGAWMDIRKVLALCARDDPTWTALCLAEHRFTWMGDRKR